MIIAGSSTRTWSIFWLHSWGRSFQRNWRLICCTINHQCLHHHNVHGYHCHNSILIWYLAQYSMKLVEKIKKGDLRRQSNVSLAKEISFAKVKDEDKNWIWRNIFHKSQRWEQKLNLKNPFRSLTRTRINLPRETEQDLARIRCYIHPMGIMKCFLCNKYSSMQYKGRA